MYFCKFSGCPGVRGPSESAVSRKSRDVLLIGALVLRVYIGAPCFLKNFHFALKVQQYMQGFCIGNRDDGFG